MTLRNQQHFNLCKDSTTRRNPFAPSGHWCGRIFGICLQLYAQCRLGWRPRLLWTGPARISRTDWPGGANPGTVSRSTLLPSPNASYSVTNASAGVKIRPFPKASKLVLTANVLVRLDSGGLRAKPAPLVGLGYTF
jgi:hypothetical protein